MKNRQIQTIRSNCNFSLDYETSKLTPQVEIIIITASPCYKINSKGDGFKKTIEVDEFRFISSLEGLNNVIGELQIAVKNMNNFEQLAGSMNAIIEANKPK